MNAVASGHPSLPLPPTARSVRNAMGWVLIALLPGIVMRIHATGMQMALQIATALAFALPIEAVLLRLRGQPVRTFLLDGSASVTALLFAMCLPPTGACWIIAIGICAALLFGKHLYGGLGRNPFNPAMLGVAIAGLCVPATLATTATVGIASSDHAWIWIAAADALGGVCLLALRIVRWQLPLAVFAGAAAGAGALGFGADALAWRGLLAGNLVLAAFFIASDPVSGCVTRRGRWVFGAGIGWLVVVLDRYVPAAAGLPFAVLLMNCAAPWIDRNPPPRRFPEQAHG